MPESMQVRRQAVENAIRGGHYKAKSGGKRHSSPMEMGVLDQHLRL
jgi:hypothetical protein